MMASSGLQLDAPASLAPSLAPSLAVSLGHSFTKKTYHRPTYCHHCGDMLWGLIGQGYSCEGGYTRLRVIC